MSKTAIRIHIEATQEASFEKPDEGAEGRSWERYLGLDEVVATSKIEEALEALLKALR